MSDLLKARCDILAQEVERLRAEVKLLKDQSTPDRVYASKAAKLVGWHHPDKLQWPGKVVHRFSKGTLELVQFIVWDKNRCQYILKTWRPEFVDQIDA